LVDTDAATAVFESAPVTVAVLYGSRSRGDHRRKSDVDFPVEFDQLLSEIERVV
jgi:predicted nucleotidyltransferase